jgi:hypothetical protein
VSERLIRGYRWVAEHDAPSRSPLYAELAGGVAQDEELIAWLDGLPAGKRQPNLLFASYRLLAGTPSGWPEFEQVLKARRDEVEAVMLERRTQTNEAARCALMLPLLARLPQPLALLEVGASAGLCLLPDKYGYDWDGHRLGDGPPVLRTHVENDPPLPTELPRIAWRAGLDLEPIDVFDEDRIHWLELLIWPGMEYRVDTLRAAVAVARRDPPRIETGDLTTAALDDLAAEAPKDATLVIFHTAVLFYVSRAGRDKFRATVKRLGATWLACEGANVLGLSDDYQPLMALAQDGRQVAWADGHGRELRWLG